MSDETKEVSPVEDESCTAVTRVLVMCRDPECHRMLQSIPDCFQTDLPDTVSKPNSRPWRKTWRAATAS
jgi:hypothetical protein